MNIKISLNQSVLDNFRANGWFDKWKLKCSVQEKQMSGESLGVSETTVELLIERIKELCTIYDCQSI